MDERESIGLLRRLVKRIVSDGVRSHEKFLVWRHERHELLAEFLDYRQTDGMPPVGSLVSAHFHPEQPLIGLNYTPAAHCLLHSCPTGWTGPLRLCRGIVFDRGGALRALPFGKFFSYGEHPETRIPPADGPIVATEKHDGHLGIAFRFRDRFFLTTRGTFTHRTAEIGQAMVDRLAEQHNWLQVFPHRLTLLVEVIHPETRVIVDYADRSELMVIGARNARTLDDYDPTRLTALAAMLGDLPVARDWKFTSVEELLAHVADRSVTNREGLVVRLPDRRRIKFKFHSYLGQMFSAKLSLTYVMRRLMDGNLGDRLAMLTDEDAESARTMAARTTAAALTDGSLRERWTRLYALLPPTANTAQNRETCRRFVRFMAERNKLSCAPHQPEAV